MVATIDRAISYLDSIVINFNRFVIILTVIIRNITNYIKRLLYYPYRAA
jgi:hypothetical protein